VEECECGSWVEVETWTGVVTASRLGVALLLGCEFLAPDPDPIHAGAVVPTPLLHAD
jgi:hypothetical protein